MKRTATETRAKRNRTLSLSPEDRRRLSGRILSVKEPLTQAPEGVVVGDCFNIAPLLPRGFVHLLFLDPPYNLSKSFHGLKFSRMSVNEYSEWLDRLIVLLKPTLRSDATIYICGDWRTSASIFEVASSHFKVRNRITWEREKGRGALRNWKNSSEDIWFCTLSDEYFFNVNAVKLRRRVIAPYRDDGGNPKDWLDLKEGKYRDTHPSNIWSDITVPFWSMPENTDHPTQKSEKLLARLVLSGTRPGDFVLDPFVGSGTTCVAAQKLGRRSLGIEINQEYALWALRRLEMAKLDPDIQGYARGVFFERNSPAMREPIKSYARRADSCRVRSLPVRR